MSDQNPETPSAVPDVKEEEWSIFKANGLLWIVDKNQALTDARSDVGSLSDDLGTICDAHNASIRRVLEKKEAVAESVAEKNLEEPRAVSGLRDVLGQMELLERIAILTAHRACCGTEAAPSNGKLHGYCVVCGVPWPCKYAGKPPSVPEGPESSNASE